MDMNNSKNCVYLEKNEDVTYHKLQKSRVFQLKFSWLLHKEFDET